MITVTLADTPNQQSDSLKQEQTTGNAFINQYLLDNFEHSKMLVPKKFKI